MSDTPATPPPQAAVAPGAGVRAPIPNHLVWAILVTLFCCLPGGIVAIVYAAQVDGKAAAGDYAGAQQSSDNAKLWCWISLGVGLVAIVAWLGLVMLGALADAGNY
ncbi:CD225/dispanin family protein [Arenimonas donghaensis]